MRVKAQNVRGSLDHDLLAITDKIGGPFTPVGFYYRTMIRPRRMWPLYEKFLRSVAGLGKVDKHRGRERRYDVEHRRAEVLVVGGGSAGREAAGRHASEGRQVIVVEADPARVDAGEGYEIVNGTALGVFEGGLVPVDAGNLLLRYRAGHVVVAAGAVEQPLVFPGNDLVGVVLPEAIRRLVGRWSLKPGERAVVIAADEGALDTVGLLEQAGTEVAEVVDLRETRVRQIAARARAGRLAGVELDGRKVGCDLLVTSGGRQPAYALLAHAGARVEYDAGRGIFVPSTCPTASRSSEPQEARSATRRFLQRRSTEPRSKGKCFVCICEDVTDKDMKRAIAEGFDSIELAKRYTTVTMGPCQGRLCHVPSIRLYARENETDESTIGTTTARPPWQPVEARTAGRPPARAGAAHVDPPPPQGARRDDDVDGDVAPPALLRRPGRRGEERPRDARRHRRVDARQADRDGARCGRVPRTPLPEPLRRHEGGPDPLRRSQLRRGPHHGRRHDRPPLRRRPST